jgi:predicted phage gp36 major capsid-like protein
MPEIDPAWIALIGTLCGGIGLKFAEHLLGKSKVKVDDATQIRDELRLEIIAQREEIKQLENDVNRWRNDYYDLRDKHVALQTELTLALQNIRAEAAMAEEAASHIEQLPPPTP